MIDKIKSSIDDISSFESKSSEEIELFRIKYLGKKGIINKLFSEFKTIDNSQKKEVGQLLNQLKNAANQKMADLNAHDLNEAVKIIAGSARSMGIEVKE